MTSKYKKIARDLRSKIESYEYPIGSVIPAEAKLQTDYDVSRYTVRQAIALLVNEGFLRTEKGSGTFVNDWSSSKENNLKAKTVGVVLTSLSDYIFPDILRGIEKVLRENGFNLLLASSNNDFKQEIICLEQFTLQGVDAIIMEPAKSNQYNPNFSYYAKLKSEGIPMLFINAYNELLRIPTVALDDIEAGRIITKYLLETDHENVAILTNWDFLQGKNRLIGYIKAHEELGITLNPKLVHEYTEVDKIEKIHDCLNKIIDLGATALVCYNDELAMDLFYELNNKLIEKVLLASVDNSSIVKNLPIILTINHPKEKLGEKAANSVVDYINKNIELADYLFKPELIIK